MRKQMILLLTILATLPLFAQHPTIDASEYAARRARRSKCVISPPNQARPARTDS